MTLKPGEVAVPEAVLDQAFEALIARCRWYVRRGKRSLIPQDVWEALDWICAMKGIDIIDVLVYETAR